MDTTTDHRQAVDARSLGGKVSAFLARGAHAWLPADLPRAASMVAASVALLAGAASISYEIGWEQGRIERMEQRRIERLAQQHAVLAARPLLTAPPSAAEEQAEPHSPEPVAEAASVENAKPASGFVVPEYDIAPEVRDSIVRAASAVGIDPAYMMSLASKESAFDPEAKNKKSSASGLFQFTNVTWMRVVQQFGARHGMEGLSSKIFALSDGRLGVKDSKTRTSVLAVRNDPYASSVMAAELALDDKWRLERILGRQADLTDMYFTHLLGIARASTFLKAVKQQPRAAATDVVPTAAETNPRLFTDRDGNPKTVAGAYADIRKSITARVAHYSDLLAETPEPEEQPYQAASL